MIDYNARRNVLVVTRGHAFERQPFDELLESVPGTTWTHVGHPAAPALFDPERARVFDAFLCYDMPGLAFKVGSGPGARGVDYVDPPPFLKVGMRALLEEGKPFIFLHHALAGWPAWREFREIVGGTFVYKRDPASNTLDSGYLHGVRHRVKVVADHPVTAGIDAEFEIEDELYLVDIDEADKMPLLRSSFDFAPGKFHSAHEAVCNESLFAHYPWDRPKGSNLIAWLKRAGNSPVIYIQCGDGPATYSNAVYRKLLANAVSWITSPEARLWGRGSA